jgi:hypothetical protein
MKPVPGGLADAAVAHARPPGRVARAVVKVGVALCSLAHARGRR